MAKIFGLNKPNTNLKKNVFDLSEKTLFSMSAGMLLPCMVRELNPGEKVKLNISSFTRTQPLNTAAFIRCRQYHHVFFVPFKQLWSGWDNFINGVDYKTSALQSGKDYSKVPTISLFDFIKAMIEDGTLLAKYIKSSGTSDKVVVDEHGFEYFRGISRLLDMLGYGFQINVTAEDLKRFGLEDYPYTTIKSLSELMDAMTIKYLKDVEIASAPYVRGSYGGGPRDRGNGTTAGPDADEHRRMLLSWRNKYGTGYLYPGYEEARRLLYEQPAMSKPTPESVKTALGKVMEFLFARLSEVQVNPFRLLAYQKIYSDFYKRDDYEATHPEHFNIDDLSGVVTSSSVNTSRMLGMLRLRYRWLPKDYFTGIVPGELFGVSGAFETEMSALFGDAVTEFTVSDSGVNLATEREISTKSIRAAFAIEKMLRLTRRAGGHDYISQISAHYGFEPPKGRGDKVDFLGGYSTTINVNEVLTTATTSEARAGELRGQGIGAMSDNKPIEFTAKEHGLIMCITSVVPETDYEAIGMNAFNAKVDRGDYFHPEFQDLGLQPVFGYELRNLLSESNRGRNMVIGFVPRYSEYKTSYDTLHGGFKNGRDLHAWSAVSSFNYDDKGTGAIISSLKVNPSVLNSVFSIKYDGTESTDQFIVQAHFDVQAIRPMSITGQKL